MILFDANFSSFKAFYIVCDHTDMRLSINGISAIIESRFHMPLFVPDTLFPFCGRKSSRLKGLLWEGDGFLMFLKRVESGRFA